MSERNDSFDLEKQRIGERLSTVEKSVTELVIEFRNHKEHGEAFRSDMRAFMAKMDKVLNGNGGPGILTRFDRIERTIRAFGKSVWIFWGAILVGIVNFFLEVSKK